MDEDKLRSGCAYMAALYFIVIIAMVIGWCVWLASK